MWAQKNVINALELDALDVLSVKPVLTALKKSQVNRKGKQILSPHCAYCWTLLRNADSSSKPELRTWAEYVIPAQPGQSVCCYYNLCYCCNLR